MAGRGRGRGKSSTSAFKPEQFGFNKNELLKEPSEEPPPIYPVLVNKPLPLPDGEEQEYFLSIKREFREMWNASPYKIEYSAVKKDIERYSDRYTEKAQAEFNAAQRAEWNMDKSRFPKELLEVARKRPIAIKPNTKNKKKKVASNNIGKTLEELEKEEKEENEEGADKSAESEGEEGADELKDDEIYDEAEMEEGTDYGMSYFDNGEDYIDNEDDNLDDGPIY